MARARPGTPHTLVAPYLRILGLTALLLSLAVSAVIISPRWSLSGPSLIDDWWGIGGSIHGLHAFENLSYFVSMPEHDRYRPAYDLWDSLQWHTLGAPSRMTGPNAWNMLRVWGFVTALVAVPFALGTARRPLAGDRGVGAVGLLLLAGLPAALVLGTPATGIDLARLGPEEPLTVGGMVLGVMLLVIALRRAIAGEDQWSPRLSRVAVPALVGYLLWLLGVYTKEVSVCFFVLAPFLYVFLDRQWHQEGVIDRPLWRYRAFRITALAALVPCLHVLVQTVRIATSGQNAYHHAPALASLSTEWDGMAHLLGTKLWVALAVSLPVVVVLAWRRAGRFPWLSVGLTLTGWAVFVFQALGSGEVATRYYIPLMALFAFALANSLLDAPRTILAAAVIAAAVVVTPGVRQSHRGVDAWASSERAGLQLVRAVADLNPRDCPVYLDGFDPERNVSLPYLATFSPSKQACRTGYAGVRVESPLSIEPPRPEPIRNTCAGRWAVLEKRSYVTMWGCRRFRTGWVATARGGSEPVPEILAGDRVRPGLRFG